MTSTEYDELYQRLIGNNTYLENEKEINRIEDETTVMELRSRWCNDVLNIISEGFLIYDKKNLLKGELVQHYIKVAHLIKDEFPLYEAVAQNILGNEKLFMLSFQQALSRFTPDENGYLINEGDFVFYFFLPFKNAFPGFWEGFGKMLETQKVQPGIADLCYILEEFYRDKAVMESVEQLIPVIQKYPELTLPKELLAEMYMSQGMWRNAIAYYEMIENSPQYLLRDAIYFSLAWCHGKIKDIKHEEWYYRKSLDCNPTGQFTKYNLGYCLMKQKKYDEALALFEECLRDHIDLPYAANNYLRTLMLLGRNKDAKQFVSKGEFKVAKNLISKVEKLSNENNKPILIKRNKKEISKEDEKETALLETDPEINLDPELIIKERKRDFLNKYEQFSSEKILEDELTARIESGHEVFGLKLRVYNHKGDYYGRQYPFLNGRLDLLCEDDKDDLYIIELKKDSGYDDVYKQTSEYLEFFSKDKISKGKKVQGIICLNNPPQKLIDQVKADNRIRLFEYQVSYNEIR